MIDRIELIADLMAYSRKLKADGKIIQAEGVWHCIGIIRRL